MELLRIVGIGLCGTLLALSLSRIQGAYGVLVGLGTGCVVLLAVMGQVAEIRDWLLQYAQGGGLSQDYIRSVLKVMGLCALTEAGSRLCRDGGQGHIAYQVEVSGRVLMLYAVLPAARELLLAGSAILETLAP